MCQHVANCSSDAPRSQFGPKVQPEGAQGESILIEETAYGPDALPRVIGETSYVLLVERPALYLRTVVRRRTKIQASGSAHDVLPDRQRIATSRGAKNRGEKAGQAWGGRSFNRAMMSSAKSGWSETALSTTMERGPQSGHAGMNGILPPGERAGTCDPQTSSPQKQVSRCARMTPDGGGTRTFSTTSARIARAATFMRRILAPRQRVSIPSCRLRCSRGCRTANLRN